MSRWTRPWAVWGLGLYALVLVVVLLSPVSPGIVVDQLTLLLRDGLGWTSLRQGWVEFAANIVLFVPVGLFVVALSRRWWTGLAVALAVSIAAEAVQVLLPGRLSSLRDVLANALGAAVGAAVAWLLVRRRRERRAPEG